MLQKTDKLTLLAQKAPTGSVAELAEFSLQTEYISLKFHLILPYNFVYDSFPTQAKVQPIPRQKPYFQSSSLWNFIQFSA
jgi:hypothetical protein